MNVADVGCVALATVQRSRFLQERRGEVIELLRFPRIPHHHGMLDHRAEPAEIAGSGVADEAIPLTPLGGRGIASAPAGPRNENRPPASRSIVRPSDRLTV